MAALGGSHGYVEGTCHRRLGRVCLAPTAARIRAFADIVAFDQRATGASEPNLAVAGRFDFPSSVSVDAPAARERLSALGSLIRTTVESRGIDLPADNTRVGAQFAQVSYVTIEGASHDFWFLRPPPRVPEVTEAFLRGEPVRDERIAWPVSFRWPD